jgi:RNA polymerase sigma-70 factor, ECF subfamily
VAPPSDPNGPLLPPADLPWLQPYPDRLLDGVAPDDTEPAAAVVARETIELAFLVAIQQLPPRQRAVLILRDVLGWPAKDTAALLEASVASANSALQRARATLKQHLPARRLDWAAPSDPSEEQRTLLQRYMDAHEQADPAALAELLAEDARTSMPPHPMWLQGREAIMTAIRVGFSPDFGRWRLVPAWANRQPAAACYLRRPDDSEYRAMSLDVLTVEGGKVVDITAFVGPDVFEAFGLPPVL